MMMNMRPIQFLIFVIFILASSTQASAVDIPVRIVNETTQNIIIRYVHANDKRGGDAQTGSCRGMSNDTLRPNDDVRCELDGREKKQRSLEVGVGCSRGIDPRRPSEGYVTVDFPRRSGWFGRTHLKNNNDIYTLKIKESDC